MLFDGLMEVYRDDRKSFRWMLQAGARGLHPRMKQSKINAGYNMFYFSSSIFL